MLQTAFPPPWQEQPEHITTSAGQVKPQFLARWTFLPQPFPSLTHPSPVLLLAFDPDNWQQLYQLLCDVMKQPPMHDREGAVPISLGSYSRILTHLYRALLLPPLASPQSPPSREELCGGGNQRANSSSAPRSSHSLGTELQPLISSGCAAACREKAAW